MPSAVVARSNPGSAGTSTSPVRALAQSPAAGNVLYAFVAIATATPSTVSAVELGTAGGGKTFTQVASVNNASHVRLYVYRYLVLPADTAETQVAITQSAAVNCVVGVYEVSSVDTATFEVQVATGTTGSGTSAQTPSLTSVVPAGDTMFGIIAIDANPTITQDLASGSPTTSWTQRGGGSSTALGMAVQDLTRAASTTTSAHSADTWTGTQNYCAITLEIDATASAPVNQTAGVLSPTGSQVVGTVLTATSGDWSNDETTYTYTWKRGSTTIQTTSATASASDTYTIVSGDIGGTITCLVAATNTNGTSGNTTDTGSALALAAGVAQTNPGGSVRAASLPISRHVTVTLDRPGARSIDLTKRMSSAPTWTTVVPGGFGSATLSFNGDQRRSLPHLAVVTIRLDQRVLFEGRIETPEVEWTGDAWTTTVQAYGKQRLLDETSIRRLWVMGVRDLKATTAPQGKDQFGTSLRDGFFVANPQAGNYDSTDPSKYGLLVLGAPNQTDTNKNTIVPSGFNGVWAGAVLAAPDGMAFTRVAGAIEGLAPAVSSYHVALIQATPDAASYTLVLATCGTHSISGNTYTGTFSFALPSGTREVRVGFTQGATVGNDYLGGEKGGQVYPAFFALKVFGTNGAPDSGNAFYGGSILTDLVAQVPGLTAGIIEAGSDFAIPEVERTQRSSARSVVDEVTSYYNRLWAVWEDGVFTWTTPNLDQTQWVVQMADGIAIQIRTDTDAMARKTIVQYTDPSDQRDHEASVDSTSLGNPYYRTGQTKDDVVAAPAGMTAVTAALLAQKLNTDRGSRPTSVATIRIPAALMLTRGNGPDLPAYCVRAGENIAIPDAPSTKPLAGGRDGETLFHIVSTSCDGTQVTLECEGYMPTADVLLARLSSVTKAITG